MTAAQEELELQNEEAAQVRGSFFVRLWRYFFALFLVLLFVTPAHALDFSTTVFSDNDADNDGVATNDDCDDEDYKVVPGEYYPCNAGGGANTGYRLCNVGGDWGSCAANSGTPLCEATGGGSCYYVDFQNGNDSTGNGSYATPWKTLRCVGYWESGAPGCNVDPAAGSVIYLLGASDYTDSYDPGASWDPVTVLFNSSRSGSTGSPVTLKRYPGVNIAIDTPGSCPATTRKGIYLSNADYMVLEDLELEDGCGSAIVMDDSANNNQVLRSYIHDIDGDRTANVAGIYSVGSTGQIFKWNLIKDIADEDETSEYSNVQGIVIFNDDTGGDHTVSYNRIGYTADPDDAGNIKGNGIKFKHGAAASSHSGNVVHKNIIWNVYNFGIRIYTGGIDVTNNLIVESGGDCMSHEEDSDSYLQDSTWEYNTLVDCKLFKVFSDNDGSTYHADPVGPITFRYNVQKDSKSSVDDSGGRNLRIDFYGTDAQRLLMLASPLTIESNRYYNSAIATKWTVYGANAGDGNNAGNAGYTTTTLATHQGQGFDLLSSVGDPSFDDDYRCTAAACEDWGWRQTSDVVEPEEEDSAAAVENLLDLLCKRRRR